MTYDRENAMMLMKEQRFPEALSKIKDLLSHHPSDWNLLYLAGQCCRFMNDFSNSIRYLREAAGLNINDPGIMLALGIALQMDQKLHEAIEEFKKAIEIDPDYEIAYNSLAMTQKKMGKLNEAIHNYDAGAKALARRIVKEMSNYKENRIFKHRNTPQQLWIQYAIFGAAYLCTLPGGIDGISWPTGEQAVEEERTERHDGLYWFDFKDDKMKCVRLFLPNYFNTFRESLRKNPTYSTMIGNRGTVLELLGDRGEAKKHFEEANYFMQ
jgi:tetratricopeptide (TPR) repeat protein